VEVLPAEAAAALNHGALVLLHSPRSAEHFEYLIQAAGREKGHITIVAISHAAAEAAGGGCWKGKSVAAQPRDHALLELAVQLCQTEGQTHGK